MVTEEERDLRSFVKSLREKGIEVRRDELIRGKGFRARSGMCLLNGGKLVILDKALPVKDQMLLLKEFDFANMESQAAV
jgi:hypothetical protein